MATLEPVGEWQPNLTGGLLRLRELQARERWISRRWMLAGAGAIGVFICLMILPSPRVLAHRCIQCSISVLEKLSPAAAVQAKVKPESDRPIAPNFSLKDASDRDIELSELKGKVVLVNFWATWCEGCQVEIPWFVEFQKQYQEEGFAVVGVSMDDDGWKSVRPWIREKKVNYPVVIGNQGLAKRYNLEGMPLTILVDRQGRIADVNAGILDKSTTQQKIKALLAENPKNTSER